MTEQNYGDADGSTMTTTDHEQDNGSDARDNGSMSSDRESMSTDRESMSMERGSMSTQAGSMATDGDSQLLFDQQDAMSFRERWEQVQSRFVDDPRTAVNEADRLIEDVMRARGYPVEDSEHRLDDLSVEHAAVVNHYRSGRDIVVRHGRGEASTEDLRKAMVHFRALFDELVGAHRSDVRRAS